MTGLRVISDLTRYDGATTRVDVRLLDEGASEVSSVPGLPRHHKVELRCRYSNSRLLRDLLGQLLHDLDQT